MSERNNGFDDLRPLWFVHDCIFWHKVLPQRFSCCVTFRVGRAAQGLIRLGSMIGSPDNAERRLIAEYETVTRFYYWVIIELSRQRGLLPRDAHDKMLKLTEDAREDCKRARFELEEFRKKRGNSK